MKITLATNDPFLVGAYQVRLMASLKEYPTVPKISMSFKCAILPAPNNLPYFETQLPTELEVTMTEQAN